MPNLQFDPNKRYLIQVKLSDPANLDNPTYFPIYEYESPKAISYSNSGNIVVSVNQTNSTTVNGGFQVNSSIMYGTASFNRLMNVPSTSGANPSYLYLGYSSAVDNSSSFLFSNGTIDGSNLICDGTASLYYVYNNGTTSTTASIIGISSTSGKYNDSGTAAQTIVTASYSARGSFDFTTGNRPLTSSTMPILASATYLSQSGNPYSFGNTPSVAQQNYLRPVETINNIFLVKGSTVIDSASIRNTSSLVLVLKNSRFDQPGSSLTVGHSGFLQGFTTAEGIKFNASLTVKSVDVSSSVASCVKFDKTNFSVAASAAATNERKNASFSWYNTSNTGSLVLRQQYQTYTTAYAREYTYKINFNNVSSVLMRSASIIDYLVPVWRYKIIGGAFSNWLIPVKDKDGNFYISASANTRIHKNFPLESGIPISTTSQLNTISKTSDANLRDSNGIDTATYSDSRMVASVTYRNGVNSNLSYTFKVYNGNSNTTHIAETIQIAFVPIRYKINNSGDFIAHQYLGGKLNNVYCTAIAEIKNINFIQYGDLAQQTPYISSLITADSSRLIGAV